MAHTLARPSDITFRIPRQRVAIMIGTRPEAIKMAPVVHELARRDAFFEPIVISTGQHREMLQQAFAVTGIAPDIDLDLMRPGQGLADFSSLSMAAVSGVIDTVQPDVLLVQGDTTTVAASALVGYYRGVKVGHVEAGLRSHDLRSPFPEEGNRRVAGTLADFHFAPTEGARRNLLREGVRRGRIFVTGNTVVDALRAVRLDTPFESAELAAVPFEGRRVLLATSHRRENQGTGLASICRALRTLAEGHDVEIVFPVHLNPAVRAVVHAELSGVPHVHLVDPLSYPDLLKVMSRSTLILSDSGGIQEEAPSFGRPILILRDTTERPEVVEAGAGVLVGTDERVIVAEATRLLSDPVAYAARASAPNPFGDGCAAQRIADVLAADALSLPLPDVSWSASPPESRPVRRLRQVMRRLPRRAA